ncbi:MAG: hypothetical protein RL456_1858 [Pseudomonadota bacterium]|jgi:hypothetical protein
MKPRWIDWLAAAAVALSLCASLTTPATADAPLIAQSR